MPRSAWHGAGVIGGSAAGAAIAVGIAAAAGGLAPTTTVREVVHTPAPDPREPAAFASSLRPLTIHDVYVRAAPGVVQVTATSPQRTLGSGFVIDKSGRIITNYHVVQGAQRVQVSFSNDERLNARVVGRDQAADVAVLQVKARSRALIPLVLGDSDVVRVGDSVVAIGNPLGEERSITSGIVSALQRRIHVRDGAPVDNVIRTDAALDRGNSGGPLLNARGEVIGVSSQIQTASGTAGNGFAIPIDTVKRVAARLIARAK